MGKRLYLAVGSSAIKGMIRLIRKYKEESLFLNTEDTFIGFDSHEAPLKKLEAVSPERGRVNAILLTLGNNDPSAKFARNFQSGWQNLRISGAGVGGDRTLSFSALDWTDNAFLKQEVESASEVIIIGTAFGGTATGMFWNLATVIRSFMPVNRQKQENKALYAFMVFPDKTATSKDYPRLFINMIAFLQDTQVLAQTNYLQSKTEIPFVYPVFPENSDGKVFKVWQPELYGSVYSYLPVDRIFVIPTPKEGEALVSDIIAEQAFLLGQLNFWEDGNFLAEVIDNASVQTGAEDLPFAALSLIVARSGKNNLIKRNFYSWLQNEWQRFRADNATDEGKKLVYQAVLELMDRDVDTDKLAQRLADCKLTFKSKTKDLAANLDHELDKLQSDLGNYKWDWPNLNDLLRHLLKNEDRFNQTKINLGDILDGLEEVRVNIENDSELIEPIKGKMREYVAKARKVSKRRAKSFVAKTLGYKSLAEIEVKENLERSLGVLLERFAMACRASASKGRLSPAPAKSDMLTGKVLPGLKYLESFINKMNSDDPGGMKATFVHDSSVKTKEVDLSEARQFLENSHFSKLLLEGMLKEDESSISEVYESEISTLIELLKGRLEEEKKEANPLRKIRVSFDDAKNIEPSAAIFASGSLGKYHKGFYESYGLADKIVWNRLLDDFRFECFKSLDDKYNVEKAFEATDYSENRHFVGKAETATDIQGIWIGEAAVAKTALDVITPIYSPNETNDWERQAGDMEKNQSVPMRLLSLPQAIAFGCLFGIIEKNLIKQAEQDDRRLESLTLKSLKIRKSGEFNIELPAMESPLGDYFGVDPVRFISCPCDWLPPIMSWIRDSFWEDLALRELFDDLSMERNICRRVTLHLPPDFREKIEKLSKMLEDRVIVEFK